MIIELEVEIEAPRERVWELFTNHKYLPQWQMSLKKVSEEKGDSDDTTEPNEVLLMHYKIGDQEQIVRETVSESIEPETFQAVYEHPRIPAHIVNTSTFVEQGDVTLWQVEQYITFTRLDYRLFGGLLRNILRQQQTYDMLRFKDWVEKQADNEHLKAQKKSTKKKTKKSSKKKKRKKKKR